jgi:hypothetical protein
MTTSREQSVHSGVTIALNLRPGEAWDLAQFLKRVGFSDFRVNAGDNDDAYRMIGVAEKVRGALARAGYALRSRAASRA